LFDSYLTLISLDSYFLDPELLQEPVSRASLTLKSEQGFYMLVLVIVFLLLVSIRRPRI